MCKAINDMIESKERENTINLYKNGVSIEIIAKSLSLPIEKFVHGFCPHYKEVFGESDKKKD